MDWGRLEHQSGEEWTRHRACRVVETDLVRLVASVAFNLRNIRTDFHGNVGDGVDGVSGESARGESEPVVGS